MGVWYSWFLMLIILGILLVALTQRGALTRNFT